MTTAEGRVARLLVNTGARRGAAVDLQTGEALEVIDLQGRQTAVLVALNADNLDEALSPAVTRGRLNSIMLQVHDRLWSNLGRPMFEIEADTVGRHDLLLPAYDVEYYEQVHSAPGHDNDRANLALALREWGIGYSELPEPLTLFGNVGIRQRGELEIRRSLAEAGDLVRLRALMPVVVAVSASPHDYNLQNDYSPTELLLRVLTAPADG
ncbi:MAG: urea carboxylase-associated family protein [Chloroflexi bacterium]|nr:urea carboxylase-associated family protein [Chloroflexota bacterium]